MPYKFNFMQSFFRRLVFAFSFLPFDFWFLPFDFWFSPFGFRLLFYAMGLGGGSEGHPPRPEIALTVLVSCDRGCEVRESPLGVVRYVLG